jgi:hypothetical protein
LVPTYRFKVQGSGFKVHRLKTKGIVQYFDKNPKNHGEIKTYKFDEDRIILI